MDWLKELLKKAGLDESKLDAVVGDVNKELPKYMIPKDKFNDLTEAKKKLETDLHARDGQLEELKKTAGASEDLKKQIETLQTENKKKDDDFQVQLKDLTLTNAIKMALTGKVHDESLVTGLFDKSKLVVDGDKIVGLDDQIKGLQETKAFLFKTEGGQPPGFVPRVGSDGKGTGAMTNEQLAAAFGNTKTN